MAEGTGRAASLGSCRRGTSFDGTVAQSRSKSTPSKKPAPSKSTRGSKETAPPGILADHAADLTAVGLGTLALLTILAVWFSALGPVGHWLNLALGTLLGTVRFVVPVLLIAAVAVLLATRERTQTVRLSVGGGLGVLALTGLAGLTGGNPSLSSPVRDLRHAGGYVGVLVGHSLSLALGSLGAGIVLLAVAVLAGVVATGIPLKTALPFLGTWSKKLGTLLATWWAGGSMRRRETVVEPAEAEPERPSWTRRRLTDDFVPTGDDPSTSIESIEPIDLSAEVVTPPPARPRRKAPAKPVRKGAWVLPSLDLLSLSTQHRHDQQAVEAAGQDLVAALEAHGVTTTLIGLTVGPTVTRYELELGAGVKVARVTTLAKDIAHAMASPDVRILAPIPGRQAIGVEVPNKKRQLVTLGDLLSSDEASEALHPLTVALGRDIAGRTVMQNVAEFPHVLISGATGAGKSSAINSLITSLLMRTTPDQVKIILIDPKRVELGQYNGVPHLLSPVVVDPKLAANALSWAVKEMERRYDILAAQGVRDITSYHEALAAGTLQHVGPPDVEAEATLVVERARAEARGEEFDPGAFDVEKESFDPLPFIVVVVDELNDLMMVAARDVEDSVVRIAQMARAVGIHLVLATQRPSVDVITGVIKANVPSRMAFSVSSLSDSRVILDQPGAERLVGKGDMLLLTASSNVAQRIQAPWVSEEEVRSVVAAWQAQGGQTELVVALSEGLTAGDSGSTSFGGDDDDELLAQARDLVVRNQLGSTSMLQRKLKVGFARAGRLMDLLEEQGVVGPSIGSKARAVLITEDQLDQ